MSRPSSLASVLGWTVVMIVGSLVTLVVCLALAFSVEDSTTVARRAGIDQPTTVLPATWRAGVRATITQGDVTIERTFAAFSFTLDDGEALDARLAPIGSANSAFTATFDVAIDTGRARHARLGAQIRNATIRIRRGDTILFTDATDDTARLALSPLVPVTPRDTITIDVESTGAGPMTVRGMWQPVTAAVPQPMLGIGYRLDEDAAIRGTALMRTFSCAACHAPSSATNAVTFAATPGPDLTRLHERRRPAHLTAWLRDPAAHRAGTAMPSLLHELDDAVARDLTHFLLSGGPVLPATADAIDGDLAATGRVLYHQVGCVACHAPLEAPADLDAGIPDLGAPRRAYVPFGDLAAATTVEALAAFLADPLAVRPGATMPDLDLSTLEARAIASYLIDRTRETPLVDRPFILDRAAAQRGGQHFLTLGCVACHAVQGVPAGRAQQAPLEALATAASDGCLSVEPIRNVPYFDLSSYDRTDLRAALDRATRTRSIAPHDELAVDTARLRCTSCHEVYAARGAEPAISAFFQTIGEADLGDEGRIPPRLTDAGARLTTAWIDGVLGRKERARPYMAARMPHFGDAGASFAARFAHTAGASPLLDAEPTFSVALAREGRTLVGSDGLNCIQCHEIAGHESTGTAGPDLALMPGRLRPSFFDRWLHDPSTVVPGTRMPTFFAGGRSAAIDVLDGDAQAQIDAMWCYLSQGEGLALPEGLVDPQGLELVVMERPIVFRTYMDGAGVRAVACGFPAQVHAAYDADVGDVALVWAGRFLSAAGAWAARGGTATNPEGVTWRRPATPALTIPDERDTVRRFLGYELAEDGTPTFLVELRHPDRAVVEIQDTLRAVRDDAGARLRRTLTVTGAPGARVRLTPSGFTVVGRTTQTPDDVTLDASGVAIFELELGPAE